MTFLMPTNSYLAVVAMGYFLGSIPFGYLLVRIAYGEDVRTAGSGNIGATNVARRSPALGVATLVLDAAKGLLAVLLTRVIFTGANQKLLLTLAALFAVLGHMFPIWLKFRGGKGVATGLGSFALIAPKSLLCVVGVFLFLVAAFRYVSLGSIFAALIFPLAAWAFHELTAPQQLVLLGTASLLIVWKHRQNIARLLAGSEPKLGAKRT